MIATPAADRSFHEWPEVLANYAQCLAQLAPRLRPEELEQLRMPVFVVWGEADRILRPEHRKFFEEHLPPHAEVHRIEEYGHAPHMSHPDCLAQRLIEFTRAVARR